MESRVLGETSCVETGNELTRPVVIRIDPESCKALGNLLAILFLATAPEDRRLDRGFVRNAFGVYEPLTIQKEIKNVKLVFESELYRRYA